MRFLSNHLSVVLPAYGETPYIEGSPVTRVAEPVNGPLMIEHPVIRSGRVTSLFDVCAAVRFGFVLSDHDRVVPADRNFGCGAPGVANMGEWDIVNVVDLHREFLAQQRWRGRPCAFTQFTLEALTGWRDGYFGGTITIREVMRLAGVSETTASRFIHGETLWYI